MPFSRLFQNNASAAGTADGIAGTADGTAGTADGTAGCSAYADTHSLTESGAAIWVERCRQRVLGSSCRAGVGSAERPVEESRAGARPLPFLCLFAQCQDGSQRLMQLP